MALTVIDVDPDSLEDYVCPRCARESDRECPVSVMQTERQADVCCAWCHGPWEPRTNPDHAPHVVVSVELKKGGGYYDRRIERVLGRDQAEAIKRTLESHPRQDWEVTIWTEADYHAQRRRLQIEESSGHLDEEVVQSAGRPRTAATTEEKEATE